MVNLFSKPFESNVNFIFDLYDFDNDNKVTKDEVKAILQYIPIKSKNEKYHCLFKKYLATTTLTE